MREQTPEVFGSNESHTTIKKLKTLQQAFNVYETQTAVFAKFVPDENLDAIDVMNTSLEDVLTKRDNVLSDIAALNIETLNDAQALMAVWFKLTMLESDSETISYRDRIALNVFHYLDKSITQ